jgi:thioredoxin-related protein
MTRTVTTIAAVLLLVPAAARADDEKPKAEQGPPAADLLARGTELAKKEGKAVFLIFGSPTCGWCKYLDKFHADPEVAKVTGKYFVFVKVDVVTNPGGQEMYKKYGDDRGVPAFTVLDTAGKALADSGNGRKNIGYPYEPEEIEGYVAVIRKTCPKVTDAEIEVLMKKLKEIGPKKEK